MKLIIQTTILGFLFGCFTVATQATAAQRQPNVLIVNIDNFIGEMLGCYGNTFIDTPNLDRFSKSAVIFNNHVSVGRCSASRASLMTGRHYVRMGALETHSNHQFLGRSEKTLGDHFRQNGYRTAMIGKWHLGNNYPYRPEDRGFDEVLTYFHSYSPKNPDGFRLRHNGRWKAFTGFRGIPWFDYAERFIRAESDRPFCLYVATSMTHAPNLGPEDLYEKYRDKLIASGQMGQALAIKRESLVERYSGDALEAAARKAVDTNIHVYAEVEFIDRGFGRLIRALHQTGQFDNTVILFCSDGNGPGPFPLHLEKVAIPEPEFRRSTFCCMMRWPSARLPGGHVLTERTANFDVLPTLLDLCGLNSIQGVTFDGQSFRSLLEGKLEAWKPRYFIMDNTSTYSQEPEWPAIRLRPLHRTTIISPKGGHATWTHGELTEQQDVTPAGIDSMKAHYLDYWASTFYTRAPIHYLVAGTEHENPMHIHKHYCPAVPSPLLATQRPGKKSTRYRWPIEFATAGTYRIQFYQVGERALVVDPTPNEYPNASTAQLTIAGTTYDWSAERGGLPTFEIKIKSGQYLLGAEINPGTKEQNPEWLVIEKLN